MTEKKTQAPDSVEPVELHEEQLDKAAGGARRRTGDDELDDLEVQR